jgi:hypothetical protein
MDPTKEIRTDGSGEDRLPVELVCLSCFQVQTIHVPREKATRSRIRWECFQCQECAAAQPAPRVPLGLQGNGS